MRRWMKETATRPNLLFPSDLQRVLLRCLPETLQLQWKEIEQSRAPQVLEQLEGSRNRLRLRLSRACLPAGGRSQGAQPDIAHRDTFGKSQSSPRVLG
jgi:hypothetical protein